MGRSALIRSSLLALLALLAGAGCHKDAPAEPTPDTLTPNVNVTQLKSNRRFPLTSLAKTTVTINGHKIVCWIMDDDAKQEEGLMWLQDSDVNADQGMLFVFPTEAKQQFWMKNTYIPLAIVYIDANKRALNVAHGSPMDEVGTPASDGPAKYVLELKDPDADKYKISHGTKIDFPDSIKAN